MGLNHITILPTYTYIILFPEHNVNAGNCGEDQKYREKKGPNEFYYT